MNQLLDVLTNYSSLRLGNLFPRPNVVKVIIFERQDRSDMQQSPKT